MSQKIILYGTPTCPMVPPVRGMLQRAQVNFEYINIHQDSDGRERVRQINNGNESVPTLVFSDGSTLTEPLRQELKGKLEALGYQVRPPTATQALRENPRKPHHQPFGAALLADGLLRWQWLADRRWDCALAL